MQTADLAKFPRSKIGPPHQPRAPIERRRLLEQLDSGAQLVLVIAPAGSGKTSLLASWVNEHKAGGGTAADINSSERPFVWYGLDPSDQDPARMVDGLAAAAEFSLPGAGAAARSMLAGGAGPYAALAALLAAFEQMTAATLILDNCHHINGARSAEAILEHITRNCPPSLRLVMSSRGIPLLPALSAVASGQLRTIGRDDLQFRTDEASVLLAQYGLPEAAVPELLRSSRGWAMGLLLHAHTHMGNVTFLQRPSEALAEYLMVQVVDSLPDLTRKFLLESALLGTFDAATADTVLERSDSWVQIDSVVRHGLFLDVYAGSTGPAVRYHDLFGEALAETLRRSAPERFIAIHTRACEFHSDDPHRALGHSAMLADPVHLAGQLDIFLPTLRRQG
ncbi:MAG: transcriptional regulator, partial [Chloroflexi bacterium]|nr:transcriptional regulator [Chloroflexota bacterium]